MKVFVSSEGDLPTEIKKYQYNVSYELLHDALEVLVLQLQA